MADNFGTRKTGRVYEGGKFYSVPATDVPANAIYLPDPSDTQFGVAEYPVASGELGAFAKVGTFAFDAPDGWTSADGQTVYYTPTGQAAGSLSASSGSVIVGHEVVVPGIPAGQIWIDIEPGGTAGGGAGGATGPTGATGSTGATGT